MTKLEQFIRENRGAFDAELPSDGHFERFAARLAEASGSPPVNRSRRFLKLAAMALILISAATALYFFTHRNIPGAGSYLAQQSHLSSETDEALHYYERLSAEKLSVLATLQTLDASEPSVHSEAIERVRSIDAMTENLKSALEESPGNPLIESAIIRNQIMKNQVLENIIQKVLAKNN